MFDGSGDNRSDGKAYVHHIRVADCVGAANVVMRAMSSGVKMTPPTDTVGVVASLDVLALFERGSDAILMF